MSQKSMRLIVIISFAITHAVIGSAQVEQGSITGSVTDQSDAGRRRPSHLCGTCERV